VIRPASTKAPAASLRTLSFDDLEGWPGEAHSEALSAFQRGAAVLAEHPPKNRPLGPKAEMLADLLKRAAALGKNVSSRTAREFFQSSFTPHDVIPATGPAHFTGYYEPEVAASLTPTAAFSHPLYGRPDDLVEIEPGSIAGLDREFRFARRSGSRFEEFPDRGAIMAGALAARGLELAYLADPVDVFFIHIQGSARLRLPDGTIMRVSYVAKSGHPYTAIGPVLAQRGALQPDNVTMETIRAWLAAHSAERDQILATNRSYIFFQLSPAGDPHQGPIGAAKVPLTAGHSLAVDRQLHSFHAPVWVETREPSGAAFNRLMIAQDTGSAIIGGARGDIFFGSGDTAGAAAGAMNATGRFVLFLPRESTP
jgi:membrane-bound lytic murein transglycosylase A